MPQKRTHTDQCPEPAMAFQDLHLGSLEFGKKLPYSSKILPFSSFIQQYKRYLLVNQTEFFCDFFTIIFILIIYLIYFYSFN